MYNFRESKVEMAVKAAFVYGEAGDVVDYYNYYQSVLNGSARQKSQMNDKTFVDGEVVNESFALNMSSEEGGGQSIGVMPEDEDINYRQIHGTIHDCFR